MTTPTPVDWEGLKAKHADPKESAMNFAGDLLDAFPAILAAHERDQRVIEAAEKALEDIARVANHQIPSYAWGDNEAAVDMDNRLGTIMHSCAEFDKAKR